MPILRKLKSLLGLEDSGADEERDVTVTVEHDPENEAAVKGADVEKSVEDELAAGAGDSADEAASAVDEEGSTGEEDSTEAEEDSTEAAEDSVEAEPTPDDVEIQDAEEPADTKAEDGEVGGEVEEVDEEAAEGEEAEEEADEEVAPDADADDDSGSDDPVDALNGIGSAYAERLGDAGVDSVADLAVADAGELSEATEIAEGRIQGWIDQAAEY